MSPFLFISIDILENNNITRDHMLEIKKEPLTTVSIKDEGS